jgi:K+-sensing histidine kinase KdpD
MLLEILKNINSISQNTKLGFEQRLRKILDVAVDSMGAKSGSIMLLKGRKSLQVVVSTKKELVGLEQRIDEESPSSWVFKNKKVLYVDKQEKDARFDKRFDHYKGSSFLVAPIISNDKAIGIISITDKIGEDMFSEKEQNFFLDITGQTISMIENQRLLMSLKKKGRVLKKKNSELRKLEQLRTDLFNMLIHDLKGPISDLMANLDILSYKISGENLEFVESAKKGCNTLYNMVSNLLDIVRLEDNRLKLLHEKIDPRELIKEAAARLFSLVTINDTRIVENYPSNQNVEYFWGDKGILLRILENLLTNAINYSPEGQEIELGFHYQISGRIEFYVTDKGPGIPQEHQKNIFDKYFQIDKKRDGRIYSTGLGLTFCKLAVEAHKGYIGLDSKESMGSRFFFNLPIGSTP